MEHPEKADPPEPPTRTASSFLESQSSTIGAQAADSNPRLRYTYSSSRYTGVRLSLSAASSDC